ncbi:ribonucleoside-triphosphate reductase class III catalytic subunit [Desulfurella multipotens]|uniref:Ribonucleoside-triphosphate reductase class III catalytic subunit n=1 Tax=Desulfurella multipotens TaxID=79269 RepID=A0A1G6P7F3_9BACT|nr:ribonucleoside triphosphate reductase [Desulfurella multipotens]SDC75335.1 ribonucleoside-triphosphate reductase class III catalytic subunit [Desulfurella multipotens]
MKTNIASINLTDFFSKVVVIKRDYSKVAFDKTKIENAIKKAFLAVGEEDYSTLVTNNVLFSLKRKFANLKEINIEDIQDTVEEELIKLGFAKVAKAYILYREKRAVSRDTKKAIFDVEKTVSEYVNQTDWRIKENSNTTFSYPGLYLHLAGSVLANYVLNNIYPKEVSDAHTNGAIHIHDLSHGIVAYCAGWSLMDLISRGFGGVEGKITAKPARHLSALTGQMVNFLGVMQMEFAGAQAFNSVDTLLAPFVRADKLDYNEVKQLIQQMVFAMNVPSRWGSQPPFINFTFDWIVPDDLKDKPVIIGGEVLDTVYGDYQHEMNMINRAFLETMLEGDAQGRIFSFPIPTYNITKDFDWDGPNVDLLLKATAKYGLPYFQNFVSSSLNPGDVRSMCCRLQLDLRELKNRGGGGLFGASDKTGSIGVVTINLPRIGYLSKTKDEYFKNLKRMMDIAKTSLEIKRKVVEQNLKNGLMPYTLAYLGHFNNHFSTIGIVGMHESLLNFMGKGIQTKEGRSFAIEVLEFMRETLRKYQQETGNLYNLEATPAEGTSYRLAYKDKQLYPDIKQSGESDPYYTNSTFLPVNYTDDPFEVLDHQSPLQVLYTSGTVVHIFLQEKPQEDALKSFIKKAFENYPIPYMTITPTFSICKTHGYIAGEHFNCPICGEETEVYSRVVGYYRPVQNWNKGKQEEFKQRLEYNL